MWKKQELIQDKYEILEYLTSGGTSLLYHVKTPGGKQALLKVVKSPDTLFNQQIDNEAATLAAIDHPSIPKLFDKFTVHNHYKAIVIEKFAAKSLSDLMEEEGRTFTWQEISEIARQLAGIIHVFHDHDPALVIRDMKPSNILLGEDNTVYVVDFGITAPVDAVGQVRALGTIGYAAPEQFEDGVVDLRSDLFSLGAVLFYLTSNGENIYTSDHETILRERLPKHFAQMIMKLTNTNPDKRYPNIAKVMQATAKVNRSYTERMKAFIHAYQG
ncbi:serine/threonine protein kinase [Gracilibacillus phocaeensis]|uniref:serine/threonine protein kinase n=1 Tax=Gracilibacillus phocaeensis TaxID=2042304 RepID=UPI001032097C|nr:serine/threonine-protein kinase [Gracilibacillus phocaeensis]